MVEKNGHGADYYKDLVRLQTQLSEPEADVEVDIDFSLPDQIRTLFAAALPHHLLHLNQAGIIIRIEQGQHPLVFDEVIGQPLSDWLTPPSAKKLRMFLKNAARNDGPSELELESLHGEAWELIILKRMSDDDSLDFLCSVADKSARYQADYLARRLGILESAALVTDQISHDLNNKLTILLGTLSLLHANDSQHESCKEHLQTMMDAAVGSRELLVQLQRRLSQDQDPQRVNLSDIIRNLITYFTNSGFVLHDKFPKEDLIVSGNSTQLVIALSNLILNALEADSADPVTIALHRVLVDDESPHAVENGPAAVVHITDNGPGILNQQTGTIFQPFFSTKRGAHGLGLPIARTAIKQHRGELHLLQNGPQGCTFQVILPIVEDEAPQSKRPVRTKRAPSLATTPLRILLLDDDHFILEVTSEMLSTLGHHAITVEDCDQAVAVYKEELAAGRKIDLAILDLVILNGPGGEEVLRELRTLDPGLRAVASSGQSTNPVMLDPQAYNFLGALPKPYSVSDISQAVALAAR